MSNSSYKKSIVAAMAETLRPAGFKKTGLNFARPVNDVIQLISLQSSVSSTASTLKVTVNIGVWLPILAEDWQKPDVWESHWNSRIGFLMPERNDFWWSVSSEPEASVTALQISEAIQRFVFPQLERLATSDTLVELWRSGVSPGLTEFQAKRFLQRLIKAGKTPN